MGTPWILELIHVNKNEVSPSLHEIRLKGETTFGRYGTTTDDNVMLPSKYMSRRKPHCKFFPTQTDLQVMSYGGMNPTFINKNALDENVKCSVHEGDQVGLGISRADNQDAFIYVVKRVVPSDDDDDVIVVSDSEEEATTSVLIPKLSSPVVSKPIKSHSSPQPSTSESVPTSVVKSVSASSDEHKPVPVNSDLSVSSNSLVGIISSGSETILNQVELGSGASVSGIKIEDDGSTNLNENETESSAVEQIKKTTEIKPKLEKIKVEIIPEAIAGNISSVGANKKHDKMLPSCSNTNKNVNMATESTSSVKINSKVPAALKSDARNLDPDKTMNYNKSSASEEDSDAEDLHLNQSHKKKLAEKSKKLKLVKDKKFKVTKNKKTKPFSRIMHYEEYEKKVKSKLNDSSNKNEIHNLSPLKKKTEIKTKKCTVHLKRLTPQEIKDAMYPKKTLEKGILVPGSGKRNRKNSFSDDDEDANNKKSTGKLEDKECLSKSKKKVKLDEPFETFDLKHKKPTKNDANAKNTTKPDPKKISQSNFNNADSGSEKERSSKKNKSDDTFGKKTLFNNPNKNKQSESGNKRCTNSQKTALDQVKMLEKIEESKICNKGSNSDNRHQEKRKNPGNEDISSKKLKIDNGPENSQVESNNDNPLANYETVIVKSEPIDQEEEWDYTQYTLDDDDIVILDEYPPSSASLTLQESQISDDKALNDESKQADDMPFDYEFNVFANSQSENTKSNLPNDLEDIDDSSSWASDDSLIFEAKRPKDMSTPKCKRNDKDVIFEDDDTNLNDNQKLKQKGKDGDIVREIFGESENEEEHLISKTTTNQQKSKSITPADDLEDVSDSISESEDKLYSDIDSPPQPSDEQSMSDVSSESSSDLFEDPSRNLKCKSETEKGKSPKLITPLPLVPRRKGRQPNKTDLVKKETKLKRKSKPIEPEFTVKPKAFYAEKIHLIKGTKDKSKGSRWVIDVKKNDKKDAQALKEVRRKKLRDLEKRRLSDEPEPSTSSAFDDNQYTDYHRIELCKPAVKLTKVNRGAFLTEDMPQGKKNHAKSSASSPHKIAIPSTSSIVVDTSKSAGENTPRTLIAESAIQAQLVDNAPHISAKEKVVQNLGSLPGKIPLVLPSKESVSKKEKNKKLLPGLSQLFKPDEFIVPETKKKNQETNNVPLGKENSANEKSLPLPEKLSKNTSNPPKTSASKVKDKIPELSRVKDKVPEPSTSSAIEKVTDSLTSEIKETAIKPSNSSALDEVPEHPTSRNKVKFCEPTVATPVQTTSRISKVSTTKSVSTHCDEFGGSSSSRIAHKVAVPSRLKGSILRQKSKYENYDDNKENNRRGPRIKFSDTIEEKLYIRDNCHVEMRRTSNTSGMTRHPLPEFKNSAMIESEILKLTCSMLHWSPKWMQQQQQLGYPPPIWKKEYILYSESEMIELGVESLSPPPDSLEDKLNLPPKAVGITFPHFDQYRREWYRLMLLELWAMVSCTTLPVFLGEITDCQQTSDKKLYNMLDVKIPLVQEMTTAPLPTGGDFVLIELYKDNQNNGQIQVQRSFGYVEKDKNVEILGRHHKMHPETFKPIVAECDLQILMKYTKLNLQDTKKIRITTCPYVKFGLKLMRALFELNLSPLKNIILSPNLKNLTEPISQELLNPYHIRKLQSFMKPVPLSEEQLDIVRKITQTIKTDGPSLNIIDGFSGTGKTRTLVGLMMSLSIMSTNRQNKQRILVCLPTHESLNGFVFTLDLVLQHIEKERRKTLKFVVIGRENKLRGAARRFSLQATIQRRLACPRERERQGDVLEQMMEDDENMLEATINSTKLSLTYAKTKDKSRAQDIERQLHIMEEKLRQLKTGIVNESTKSIREINRLNHIVKEILQNQTDIIITTLSGLANNAYMSQTFGSNMYAQTPICLIDDAHMAPELQCLLPLIFGAYKVVLAGNLLLPGTTHDKSQHASKLGLSNSLLTRVNRSIKCEIQNTPEKSGLKDIHEQLKGHTYYKLRTQRRIPRILSDIATECLNAPKLIPGTKIPWENFPVKPREFLIFDHDFPVVDGQRIAYEDRNLWLFKEYQFAFQIINVIQRTLARHPQNTYNIMVLVPEDEDHFHMDQLLRELMRNIPGCTYFVSTLDDCGGISANIVIACLGDETSRLRKMDYVTLALTRVKIGTFIVLGHLDYCKKEKHWLEILKKSEKYRSRLSVSSSTDDRTLADFIFKHDTAPPRTNHVPVPMDIEHNDDDDDEGSQLVIDMDFNPYNRFIL